MKAININIQQIVPSYLVEKIQWDNIYFKRLVFISDDIGYIDIKKWLPPIIKNEQEIDHIAILDINTEKDDNEWKQILISTMANVNEHVSPFYQSTILKLDDNLGIFTPHLAIGLLHELIKKYSDNIVPNKIWKCQGTIWSRKFYPNNDQNNWNEQSCAIMAIGENPINMLQKYVSKDRSKKEWGIIFEENKVCEQLHIFCQRQTDITTIEEISLVLNEKNAKIRYQSIWKMLNKWVSDKNREIRLLQNKNNYLTSTNEIHDSIVHKIHDLLKNNEKLPPIITNNKLFLIDASLISTTVKQRQINQESYIPTLAWCSAS